MSAESSDPDVKETLRRLLAFEKHMGRAVEELQGRHVDDEAVLELIAAVAKLVEAIAADRTRAGTVQLPSGELPVRVHGR